MLDKPADIAAVRQKVAAFGHVFDPGILEATRAIYAPLVQAARTGVRITKDVAYGTDERQKLDIYAPAQAADRVLIYIPGGGFVAGGKDEGTGVFYRNLGTYFADHGILTIVANYRLAPAHAYPAGAQDVAAVVAWAGANARQHGGNPYRIVLYGQSAGATHCAGYLFDRAFHPASGVGVSAAILMSGPYKVEGELRAGMLAYFGGDKSAYAARSPLTHAAKAGGTQLPLLLSVAEYDPGYLAAPTYELALALTQRDGKSPHVAYFSGHNHVSTVMSFGTAQDDVGAAIRGFIASAT